MLIAVLITKLLQHIIDDAAHLLFIDHASSSSSFSLEDGRAYVRMCLDLLALPGFEVAAHHITHDIGQLLK